MGGALFIYLKALYPCCSLIVRNWQRRKMFPVTSRLKKPFPVAGPRMPFPARSPFAARSREEFGILFIFGIYFRHKILSSAVTDSPHIWNQNRAPVPARGRVAENWRELLSMMYLNPQPQCLQSLSAKKVCNLTPAIIVSRNEIQCVPR